MKKKKCCWFYHNISELQGYSILHIGGKKTEAPKTETIVKLVQCSDCLITHEIFHMEVSADTAQSEVKALNESQGLKPNYQQIIIPSKPIDFI